MKILIAEDDMVSRRVLEMTLTKWGHEVISTFDGTVAWAGLQRDDAPPLAILDWMMPGLDGVEICRKVRQLKKTNPTYVILLTAKTNKDDIVTGLDAGADDYLTKPFNRDELRARVEVGVRILHLQEMLTARVQELEDAFTQVRQLRELLPICSYCKSVRDDHNYWQQIDRYISEHTHTQFSHGICPDCYEKQIAPQLEKSKQQRLAAMTLTTAGPMASEKEG